MPSSISSTVTDEGKRLAGVTLRAHVVTPLSALPAFAFRSSTTMFVSTKDIKTDPLVGVGHR
jgi:hypothetical protein